MNIKEFLFSKKYGSLYSKVAYFFKYKIPFVSKGWYEWHFPYYHWWKARKYFKRPKAHFIFAKYFWTYGLPVNRKYYNPIIDIEFSGLGWKTKYDEYRHEWDPMINIVLFRKWHIMWVFNWINKDEDSTTASMATWEAMLDYLYRHKTLKWVVDNHRWGHGINEDSHIITIHRNLTKKGLQKINNY